MQAATAARLRAAAEAVRRHIVARGAPLTAAARSRAVVHAAVRTLGLPGALRVAPRDDVRLDAASVPQINRVPRRARQAHRSAEAAATAVGAEHRLAARLCARRQKQRGERAGDSERVERGSSHRAPRCSRSRPAVLRARKSEAHSLRTRSRDGRLETPALQREQRRCDGCRRTEASLPTKVTRSTIRCHGTRCGGRWPARVDL